MISVHGGPFGITITVLFILAAGAVLGRLFTNFQRPDGQEEYEQTAREADIIITQASRQIDTFVHEFGQAIFDFCDGAPWLARVTLHDLRTLVNVAIFDLIQGCACGGCVGRAGNPRIAVEASYSENGISLHGIVSREVIKVEVGGRLRKAPDAVKCSENVTMVCACGKPVVTSIDQISQGKQPKCASCVSKGANV